MSHLVTIKTRVHDLVQGQGPCCAKAAGREGEATPAHIFGRL